MRIRKNASRILSSLSILSTSCAPADAAAAAAGRELETHVCDLNQSPWDVMAFTPPGAVPLYRYQMPLQVEDVEERRGFAAGARLSGQSEEADVALSDISGITAAGSTSTCQVNIEQNTAQGAEDKQKRERKKRTANHNTKKIKRKTTSTEAAADENKLKVKVEPAAAATAVAPMPACKKSDGKGWHCKREAQRPHSLCEYHLTQVRSYYINSGTTAQLLQQHIKKNKTKNNSHGDGNRTRKPESDFLYCCSRFGPPRRKRRSGDDWDGGDRKPCNVDASKGGDDGDGASDTHGAPPRMVHDQAPDDLDVDDDDTDDVDDLGGYEGFDVVASKGRVRKPIKARSLNSLL